MEEWQCTRYFKLKSESLGQGKMTYTDEDSYDGDWVEGKKEGFGTFRYVDGAFYVGEFKNGERHGTLN